MGCVNCTFSFFHVFVQIVFYSKFVNFNNFFPNFMGVLCNKNADNLTFLFVCFSFTKSKVLKILEISWYAYESCIIYLELGGKYSASNSFCPLFDFIYLFCVLSFLHFHISFPQLIQLISQLFHLSSLHPFMCLGPSSHQSLIVHQSIVFPPQPIYRFVPRLSVPFFSLPSVLIIYPFLSSVHNTYVNFFSPTCLIFHLSKSILSLPTRQLFFFNILFLSSIYPSFFYRLDITFLFPTTF